MEKKIRVTLTNGKVFEGKYFEDLTPTEKQDSCGKNADEIFENGDVFIYSKEREDNEYMKYVPVYNRILVEELSVIQNMTFEDALSIVLADIRCPKCMGCAQNICPNGNAKYGKQFDCRTLRTPEVQAHARKVIKKGL